LPTPSGLPAEIVLLRIFYKTVMGPDFAGPITPRDRHLPHCPVRKYSSVVTSPLARLYNPGKKQRLV
jgi:hypothetical protein